MTITTTKISQTTLSSKSEECSDTTKTTTSRPQTSNLQRTGKEQTNVSVGVEQDNINVAKLLLISPSTRPDSQLRHIKASLKELYKTSRQMVRLTDKFRAGEEKHKRRIMDDLLYIVKYTDNPQHVKDGILYLQERYEESYFIIN